MPTLRPSAARPSARFTAVVDLPTPPLPEATAMMAPTPGRPGAGVDCGVGRGRAPAAGCAGAAARAPPGVRSPVSAIMADTTPGTARTAASAALRTASQAGTAAASTVIEKNTLPSVTTTSD